MKNGCSRRIRLLSFCAAACLSLSATAQTVPDPKIETPNTATLDKFGTIPIDYFTGVPNISIPIHSLKYGHINVPISLRYHPGSVRPTQHAGWVGMGWDLESIGSITRHVNGFPDEYYVENGFSTHTSLVPYYPLPVANRPASGSELVDVTNWNTNAELINYFTLQNTALSDNTAGTVTDVLADEFSFNFLGYSGEFYYASPTKGWQVACDQNITVTMINPAAPCLDADQILGYASHYPNLYANEANTPEEDATQVFAGFILTVPDGTKYYFGGTDASTGLTTGLELHMPYGGVQFSDNTWLLTRIVDVDSNEVDFHYSGSYANADLGIGYQFDSWGCNETYPGKWGISGYLQTYAGLVSSDLHGGDLTLPLYLDSISCPSEVISFKRTESTTGPRTPDEIFLYPSQSHQTLANEFDLNVLGENQVVGGAQVNPPNNIQWEQLDSIVISNRLSPIFRKYVFNYNPAPTLRLSLQNLSALDAAGNSIEKYSFAYNTVWPSTELYDGDNVDHWGFYNDQTVIGANTGLSDGQAGSIFSARQTNQFAVTDGLLNQITYPTGGNTQFTWEAHNYAQVVSSDRQSLVSNSGWAGGSRIREVQSYLADGSLALDNKYFYVRGYTAAGGANGLPPSGILNGIPAYSINIPPRTSVFGNQTESMSKTSINSLGSYAYNGEGSYIGYDEVAEVQADGSYTRHLSTSYFTDLNGVSHFDQIPIAYLGWQTGDTYFPMDELDGERGKPIAVYKYTAKDVLVEKTNYTYRNDPGRFNNYIKLITFNGSFSGCSAEDGLVFSTAKRKFSYDYYVTNEATTTYDQYGKNPIATSLSYTYNINNLDSTKTEIDSKGEIQTTYLYPTNFTDATSLAMVAAHIIDPVIQTIVTNNGNPVSVTKMNYYSPNPGRYKPQTIQVQIIEGQ